MVALASGGGYATVPDCSEAALLADGPLMIPTEDPEASFVSQAAAIAIRSGSGPIYPAPLWSALDAPYGIALRPTGTRNIPLSPIDLGQANTGAALASAANAGPSVGFGTFCRVTGEIYTSEGAPQYSVDGKCNNCSVVTFELRLPHSSNASPTPGSTWNGKYMQYAQGNYGGDLGGGNSAFAFTSVNAESQLSAAYAPPPGVPSGNGPGEWKSGGYVIGTQDEGNQTPCNRPLQSSPFIPALSGGLNGTNCADINQLSGGTAPALINNDGTQNPTRINNFYRGRSRHLLAVVAKEIIRRYYGSGPSLSIHGGSSSGGRSGLTEAERYPSDFDGILAGFPNPVNVLGRTAISFVLYAAIAQKQFPGPCTATSANDVLACLATQQIKTNGPDNLLPYIASRTMAVCDPRDGLADGVLADPRNCGFDPDADLALCPTSGPIPRDGAGLPLCLNAAQKDVLKAMYSDFPVLGSNDLIARGFLPGYESERVIADILGATGAVGTPPTAQPASVGAPERHMRYLAFGSTNPEATIQSLDLTNDGHCLAFSGLSCGSPISSTAATLTGDLTSFSNRGGKLFLFHGTTDQQVSTQSSVDYYQNVVSSLGGLPQARQSARFFLIPGRAHGASSTGGVAAGAPGSVRPFNATGAVVLGWVRALEKWLVTGVAPDSLLGESTVHTGGLLPITRPICAYPYEAVYTGPAGDTAAMRVAANFECRYYNFAGFSSPVDDEPTVNAANAGQAIPVKFSLGGDWGLNIFASGFPVSEQYNCDSNDPEDNIEEVVPASGTSLEYDASSDQYKYTWKTQKSWKGTCRELVIRLNEGTTLRAKFSFK